MVDEILSQNAIKVNKTLYFQTLVLDTPIFSSLPQIMSRLSLTNRLFLIILCSGEVKYHRIIYLSVRVPFVVVSLLSRLTGED